MKNCVFGVKGEKCLGFLVDERQINANPNKINAISNMSSSRNVREAQKLTWCLAALRRFLSRLADKSLLFFQRSSGKSLTGITRGNKLSNS